MEIQYRYSLLNKQSKYKMLKLIELFNSDKENNREQHNLVVVFIYEAFNITHCILYRLSVIVLFYRLFLVFYLSNQHLLVFLFFYFLAIDFLSVLRGHLVFSSPPQRPMTSDFEGFSIPDVIHFIFFS